jgi:hypothetical protein
MAQADLGAGSPGFSAANSLFRRAGIPELLPAAIFVDSTV